MFKTIKASIVILRKFNTQTFFIMATKKIDLALQGGGAHGAYTWGVIDRLLDDERIDIDGICGTSAGAMNGVCAIYG